MSALAAAGVASVCAIALMWSLRGLCPPSPVPHAIVAVVIPTRNEAHRLPRLLASLATQTHPADHVIVMDDMSTDATRAIARSGGATVLKSGGPPPGWTGKTWALAAGVDAAAAAGADVLVLVDADVRFRSDGLARLRISHRRLAPEGLLSVQPYHVTKRPFEQLSAIPNLVSVMASGLAALRPPTSSTVAFGPCLITTPAALNAVGGVASVRREVIEDIALARRYREHDRTVCCRAGRDVVRFRMYEAGPKALFDGWTKNLSGGARRAAVIPVVGTVLWVGCVCAVIASAIGSLTVAAAVAWAIVAAQLWWMLRRLGRFGLWTSLLFPVPVVAFVVLFAASMVRRVTLRSVRWSGRSIVVGRSRR